MGMLFSTVLWLSSSVAFPEQSPSPMQSNLISSRPFARFFLRFLSTVTIVSDFEGNYYVTFFHFRRKKAFIHTKRAFGGLFGLPRIHVMTSLLLSCLPRPLLWFLWLGLYLCLCFLEWDNHNKNTVHPSLYALAIHSFIFQRPKRVFSSVHTVSIG